MPLGNRLSDGRVDVTRSMPPDISREDRETDHGPDPASEERGWE